MVVGVVLRDPGGPGVCVGVLDVAVGGAGLIVVVGVGATRRARFLPVVLGGVEIRRRRRGHDAVPVATRIVRLGVDAPQVLQDRSRAAEQACAAAVGGGARDTVPRSCSLVGEHGRRGAHVRARRGPPAGVVGGEGRGHHGGGDRGARGGARQPCGAAVSHEADEARADAVGEGFDEVGEAVAHVHVVDDGRPQRLHRAGEQVQTHSDVLLGGAQRERLQQNDGHADDAEESAHGRVAQIVARVEPLDDDFEHVARCVDDLVDVVPVVAVPLCQRGEGDRAPGAVGRVVRVVRAPLDHGLQRERVEVHARVFELDDEDVAELGGDCNYY